MLSKRDRSLIEKAVGRLMEEGWEAESMAVSRLFNAARAERVPEGWKLVPVEPTPEMVESGADIVWRSSDDTLVYGGETGRWMAADVYRAMLSTAPDGAERVHIGGGVGPGYGARFTELPVQEPQVRSLSDKFHPRDERSGPVPAFMVADDHGAVLFREGFRTSGAHVRYTLNDEMIELDGEFTADELRAMAEMVDGASFRGEPETTAFQVIARIREVTGLGHGPMLSELPEAIAELLNDRALTSTKESKT